MMTLILILLSAALACVSLSWITEKMIGRIQQLPDAYEHCLANVLLQFFSITLTTIFGLIAIGSCVATHFNLASQSYLDTVMVGEMIVCCLMAFAILGWLVELIWDGVRAKLTTK